MNVLMCTVHVDGASWTCLKDCAVDWAHERNVQCCGLFFCALFKLAHVI
jgi:hypothetical protein